MMVLEEWLRSRVLTVRACSGLLSKCLCLLARVITGNLIYQPILMYLRSQWHREGEPLRKEGNLWLENWAPSFLGWRVDAWEGKGKKTAEGGNWVSEEQLFLSRDLTLSSQEQAQIPEKAQGTSLLDLDAPGKSRPTLETNWFRLPLPTFSVDPSEEMRWCLLNLPSKWKDLSQPSWSGDSHWVHFKLPNPAHYFHSVFPVFPSRWLSTL